MRNMYCYRQYDQNKSQLCIHKITSASSSRIILTANNQYYATLIRAAAALWPHIYSAGNCEGNEASQSEGTVS